MEEGAGTTTESRGRRAAVIVFVVLRLALTLLALSATDPGPGQPAPEPPPEPEEGPRARRIARARRLLRNPRVRRSAYARFLAAVMPIVALLLIAAAVGLWALGVFSPDSIPEAATTGNLTLGLLLLGLAIGAVWVLWRVPQWQAEAWAEQEGADPRERFEIENQSRATLGQILSGVAVLTGLVFAWQQLGSTTRSVQLSEQGQITDRFSRAVEQLGSDNLSARIGGIYALEQIARDSERDLVPAMEVLAEYVRETAGDGSATPTTGATPARTVVAALRVIGNRTDEQVALQIEQGITCLDLTGSQLAGIELPAGANLSALCLDEADLTGAILPDASFAGSNLGRTRLETAILIGASFDRSTLSLANLVGADLTNARIVDSALNEADLTQATLIGTRFEQAQLLGANLGLVTMLQAQFIESNLADVSLANATVQQSDLATVSGLTDAQIASVAFIDAATLLPPELDASPEA